MADHDRNHLRSAEPDEAKELEELQIRSASHWDYPDGYFDWAGDSLRITESYVRDNPVLVLVDDDGRKLGFYSFTDSDEGLLLDKMFLDVDQIGRGLGRLLWKHAVQTARDRGVSEFVIGADPNAAPFYEAMGAAWYDSKPTEEPTWTVQMYRYVLPSDDLTVLLTGTPASPGRRSGTANVIAGLDAFDRFEPGDVLVCRTTSPAWTPLLARAAAVVTETGGVLSHAAIVAREFGIPAVVAAADAMTLLGGGQVVLVDGSEGFVMAESSL
jgi:phosphoenolpyruvate synthase/pyruvate phosphate dikinase